MENRILYALCFALLIVALYASWRCEQAYRITYDLQSHIITKGVTNK